MSGDNELIPRPTARPSDVALQEKSARGRPADFAQPVWKWLRRTVCVAEWRQALVGLFLAAITIAIGFADTATDRIVLPIEVLGADGTVVSRTVTLPAGQAEPVRSLWLQVHGLRYADQASVQVNTSAWMPLNNNTVTIAEPGKTYGGIGGGFATLAMTLALPDGTVVGGDNTIRFRFNHTDGFVSSYRVLAFNFLDAEGKKILPANDFVEDAPERWTPPLPDAASIQAGKELWHGASLAASSLPNSPTLQARCADCHAQDGRDLKYFNFSNASIIARARFHGLSELQSEQIASYIRSLPLPSPGRPWNPPYQPGPGLDEQPVSNWAAGAGLAWVLDQDTDALPYLIGSHGGKNSAPSNPAGKVSNLGALAGQITPGNLSPRWQPQRSRNPHRLATSGLEPMAASRTSQGRMGTSFQPERVRRLVRWRDSGGQEQGRKEAAAAHAPGLVPNYESRPSPGGGRLHAMV